MKMDIVYSLQAQQESSYPTTLKNIDTWPSDRVANYTGSDRKDGVISPDGRRYLIKYAQKHTGKDDMDTSDVNNALSEYLSSHILGIIGCPVHHTFLATRNGELVVACENFIQKDQELIEFGTYMRKQYDSAEISRVPRYRQIKEILSTDPDLRMNPGLWNDYCRRFVGDAFVGNFDRHMGNWGYLVSGTDRTAPPVPAPVYDNGSTLFPALSSKEMHTILPKKKKLLKRTLLFPKAALAIKGQKISYMDMLSSNFDPAMTEAVLQIVPVIQEKMPEIKKFFHDQTFLSDTKKTFYQIILQTRLNFLLEPALEACRTGKYHPDAKKRLKDDIAYTEADFERDYDTLCRDAAWQQKLQELEHHIK